MDVHAARTELQRVPAVAGPSPMLYADLERLVSAPDCYFEAGFSAFVQQLSQAFQSEEQRLHDSGAASLTAYQALHAEVIRLMLHAQSRNLVGDYALARKIIRLLPEWCSMNAPRMDWPTNPGTETGQAPASSASSATPASSASPASPASPATPATPATPASSPSGILA